MNKYEIFDYLPGTIYGDDLPDALIRQGTLKTKPKTRRLDSGQIEYYDQEEIIIDKVIEVIPPEEGHTRGNKQFETALCESFGKIIPIDIAYDPRSGRPPIYDQPMKQTAIWLPEEMLNWLKQQPKPMSEIMRDLIKDAMEK